VRRKDTKTFVATKNTKPTEGARSMIRDTRLRSRRQGQTQTIGGMCVVCDLPLAPAAPAACDAGRPSNARSAVRAFVVFVSFVAGSSLCSSSLHSV